MVKNPIRNYAWWFKLIGGVILLSFAIAMIVQNLMHKNDPENSLAAKMVVGVTGGIVLLYALYRLFPLFKTVEMKGTKWLCILEIILDIAVGVLLITGGFNFNEESSKYSRFVINNYRYFLGAVLYLRGLIYFISSIIFGEKSDGKQFVANLVALTFGVVIICRENFGAVALSWVMIALSALSGGYLVGEGGYQYAKYRNSFKENRDNKDKEKSKEDEIEDGIGEKPMDEQEEKKEEDINIPQIPEDEIGQTSDMPN